MLPRRIGCGAVAVVAVETLIQRIIRHEGAVTRNGLHIVYRDSLGHSTIGYGALIDPPGGLTEAEAQTVLQNRINTAVTHAMISFPWFGSLDANRQDVVVELIFQIGLGGLLGFKHMLSALESGDYATAADELQNSELAQQTPSRTNELAGILRG